MLNHSGLYRIFLLVLLFFSAGGNLIANKTDSTENRKEELYNEIRKLKNDSLKIIKLIDLSILLHVSDVELYHGKSGKYYINKALELASKELCCFNLGNYIDSLGVLQRNMGKFQTALHLHNVALEYAAKKNDEKLMSKIYNNIGVVYRRINDYKKALSNHFKALEIAEKRNDSTSMAIAINSIGNVELMMGDYQEGLKYFKRSLMLERNRSNMLGIAINLENLGMVFLHEKKYGKAAQYFKLSLEINKKIKSEKGMAICYSDLAEVYKAMGNYKSAEIYLKHSLQFNTNAGDKTYMADNYIKLGQLYSKTGNFNLAVKFLNKGLELAKEIGIKSSVEEAYRMLYQLYKNNKKYKEALENLELADIYHDSLINVSLNKDIARLQMQYETERKENQILLLKQQARIRELNLKKQKFLNYFFIAAFASALVIMMFLTGYLLNKNKLNKLLVEKNREIEKAKEELEKSGKELEKAKREAEESNRYKSIFLANMSHEIRTPLNSVIGFADILSTLIKDQKIKQYVSSIKSSGESLLALINDILDLSKIEAGKLDVVLEPMDIEDVLDSLKKIFSVQAASKGLEFNLSVQKKFPGKLMFSKNRLRQILFNLIGNAIKFTGEGSVCVNVDWEETAENGKINLYISVKDTGKGIAKKDREKIFTPFFQSDNTDKEIGTGLGLAITQRLVSILGGKIFLKSELGSGSEFKVVFENVTVAMESTDSDNENSVPGKLHYNAILLKSNSGNFEYLSNFLKNKLENVTDVGSSLLIAKNHIDKCDFIIIAGFEEEMLINAVQLIKKERPSLPCILLGNKNSTQCKSSFVIDTGNNISEKKILELLNEKIDNLDYILSANSIFNTADGTLPDYNVLEKLINIVENDFSLAMETKLMKHISIFAEKLSKLSSEADMPNLLRYSSDLKILVDTFNITGIEEKLNLFKEAFELNFKQKNI